MKKLHAALAIAAITAGSVHADIVYSSEDFEGGTPNYEVTGNGVPYALTQLTDEFSAPITPAVAFAGTDYTPTSPSNNGIFANGNLPGTIANEPSGQHGFVALAASRRMVLANPMTLVTDGVEYLEINFSTMVYAFDDGVNPADFTEYAVVEYSALGDFSDPVQIATYAPAAVSDPGTALAHRTVVEDTWTTLNLSISSSEVTFTDTAQIRFWKFPFRAATMVFYDDIAITGVTASAPAAPFVATIAPAVDPNTGYDLQWTSQAGKTYSVLTSADLATPVESWTSLQTGIAPTPPQNSYNVPADGPHRFYAIKETPVP